MSSLRIAIAGIVCAVMTGCAGTKLEDAQNTTPSADEYGNALYAGYVGLSEAEYSEGDYKDSDVFAERAIASAGGKKFEPENIAARALPADKLNEMASARREIITADFQGARDKMPLESAEAQISFDCWMQEQEENFQPEDIAACRDRFETAMQNIKGGLSPTPASATGSDSERLVFDVFFDFDSDKLGNPALTHIGLIAETIGQFKNPVVAVIGNADQSGTTNYNYDLAQRRADAVAAQLRESGIEPSGVFNHADEAPAVDKPERTPDRLNRRVTVVVRES